MNIKDPAVHEMAKDLAARRHTTVTGAVRDALSEALRRDDERRAGLVDDLVALAQRSSAKPDRFLTDADLYDDQGLPR